MAGNDPLMSAIPTLARYIEELLEGRPVTGEVAAAIRAELVASSKRAETLSAVASTAVAIANVLSVSDVFSVAIERARALVQCDLAYLTVFDEATGRSSVRASTGVRSPEFNSAQVPLGFGVGGIVAGARRPFATHDYLTDKSLKHLEAPDRTASAEGIRAMAAVPLFARDRLIAILFVADRRVRTYLPEEITALESLGLVVAVAIENAKLFEAREAALADIQTAYDSLRKRIATTERVANIHDQVAKIVASAGPYESLVEPLARDLHADVVLCDPRGEWLAAAVTHDRGKVRDELSTPVMRDAVLKSIASGSLEPLATAREPDDHMVMAVAVGGVLFGTLAVFSERRLLGTERRMIERTCQAAGLLLLSHERQRSRQTSERASLLKDCIIGMEAPYLADRAAKFNLDLAKRCILVGVGGHQDRTAVTNACIQAAGAQGVVSCEYAEFTLALLNDMPGDAVKPFVLRVSEWLHLEQPLPHVFTPCEEPLKGIADEVKKCVRLLRLKQGSRGTSSETAIAEDELDLLTANSSRDLIRFRDRYLGPLTEYDRQNSTELVSTLEHLLRSGMSVADSALELGIHPKTVSQRIQRMNTLLGENWREGDSLFRIQLALRVHKLLGPGT